LPNNDAAISFEGLDILHWKGDQLVLKSTYAKTSSPVIETAA